MPINPNTQSARFQFSDNGLITKEAADLLKDGQYRSMSNMECVQEGSITTRSGRRTIGQSPANCQLSYMIRKMTLNQNDSIVTPDAGNLRYVSMLNLGSPDLFRTIDYNKWDKVCPAINTEDPDKYNGLAWSMAPYSPGGGGAPWAFVAGEKTMVKDRGAEPFSAYTPDMGILTATNSLPITFTCVANHGIPTNTTFIVTFTGANLNPGTTYDWLMLEQRFYATSTGATTFTIPVDSTDWGPYPGFLTAHIQALQNWGIRPAFGVAESVANGMGNLDSSGPGGQYYDWRYTYVAGATGNEGNPSQVMLDTNTVSHTTGGHTYHGVPLGLTAQQALVLVWGTDDPQVTSINIYRRGGIFFDTWRLVGTVANPRGGNFTTFSDNAADTWIIDNPQISVYADPPVPSRPPQPITGSMAVIVSAGRQTVDITLGGMPAVTPGTTMHIFYDNPEDVTIEQVITLEGNIYSATAANPVSALTAVPHDLTAGSVLRMTITGASGNWAAINGSWLVTVTGVNLFTIPVDGTLFGAYPVNSASYSAADQFVAYFQRTHLANANFEIDTIAAYPSTLAISYGQFLIVAGDPNNPHLLYRSTGDSPEYFPPVPADGSTSVIAAGSPSNPIIAITEFRGEIITLNLYSIYATYLVNGSFLQPTQAAYRGIPHARAWCKTDTEIWLLSYDGIYSWDGGTLRKRSTAIDPIFHGGATAPGPLTFGQYINGFSPLDYTNSISCVLESHHGEIHLTYGDTTGNTRRLICEPMFNDRWRVEDVANASIDYVYNEPDTQSLVEAQNSANTVFFNLYDQQVIAGGVNYTSDYFTTNPQTQGVPIPFDLWLPWIDMGDPTVKKILLEGFMDLDLSGSSTAAGAVVHIDVLIDFNDTPVDTIQVTIPIVGPAGSGNRQLISLVPGIDGGNGPKGREARAISYRIHGSAYPTRMTFYNLIFRYQVTGDLTAGTGSDWDNLGSRNDKRVYQMRVEFDSGGSSDEQLLVLDTISGRDSIVYNPAIQEFLIVNPNLGAIPGSTRGAKIFAMNGAVVAKLFRVRAMTAATTSTDTSSLFKILGVEFIDKEEYPPDVVSFTPWNSNDYSYLKYANQITLEVNTNNVEVTVELQADGVTKWTFTVQSTESDRERNITVPPNLTGYFWRLFCDPTQAAIFGNPVGDPTGSQAGMFQLFHYAIRTQPADKGEVIHTEDWKDHGWQFDKRFSECTIEWDNTSGFDVVMQMDLLSGIDGGTMQLDVAEFNLGANQTRSEKTFPLQDGLIAKKTRVYPKTTPLPYGFKDWSYTMQFEKFPPDILLFTEPKDFQWPYRKLARNLILKIDTGGVDCVINLLSDAATVETFTVNTTLDDWRRFYACQTNLPGRLWKLHLTPGMGGKAQLFDWDLEIIKLPAEVTLWSSYEWSGGYAGWKFIKQVIVQYQSPVPICVTIISETGSFTKELPAHTSRTPERFYVPALFAGGFCKSRIYDIIVQTSTDGQDFSIYPDASWIEWIPIGADRHSAYQRTILSEMMQLAI